MSTDTELEKLKHTKAGAQWQKIGIKHHHGIAIPLFSLRTSHSCGIGEYLDLIPLIEWCKKVGFDVIQLLPLNDTGNDSSPYNALSAFALNPLHLSLSALPNVEQDSDLQDQLFSLQELNRLPRVNYPKVIAGKMHFLRCYLAKHMQEIQSQNSYQQFVQESSWLEPYGLFKTLKKHHGGSCWEEWPETDQTPSPAHYKSLLKQHAAEIDFYSCVQYLCDLQLKQIKAYAEQQNILIKGDIPILISRDSADVWHHRKYFDVHYSAGAPPDMYSASGQNWGFPIYDWQALKKDHYHWWKERLKVASRYYHLYRIDHIVGFFRIWAIPLAKSAALGSFMPSDATTWEGHGRTILQIMLAATPEMLPIGEDLGTIPPEARSCMKHLGICGTKVMRWERNWNSDGCFIAAEDYATESMTTVSTHDSETLAQWWKNQKEEAKLLCKTKGWNYEPELSYGKRYAILWESHHTQSLFHINLLPEYLAFFSDLIWPKSEDERINVPGSVVDTNWSYRMKPTIEQLQQHAQLEQLLRTLAEKIQ